MTPNEALADLYQRLVDAEAELSVLRRDATRPADAARIEAKAQGVALARDYVRHTMAVVEQTHA